MDRKRLISLILGPLLMLLAALVLPDSYFGLSARLAIGLVLWMACWWITMPVAVGVTALLPIGVNAIFNMVSMDSVISQYFSEIVVLLLGAEIIALTWERTGLDKRISLMVLCLVGPSMRRQIIVWFVLPAVLSMFLPNAVVCAIMTPLALSMLRYTGEGDVNSSKVAPIILVSIAWGAGIGGLGTPMGGAMNLVAVNYLEQLTGAEFMYTAWAVRLLPFLAVLIVVDLVYLMIIRPKSANLSGSTEFFRESFSNLGKMSRAEMCSLVLFAAATVLAFIRPIYTDLLPGLKPAYVFLIAGIVSFVLSFKQDEEKAEPLISWNKAEKGVSWGLLFLFAGGLALGTMISDTGAADGIAEIVANLNLDGGLLTILIFVTFTVVLAEVASNTAAAAIAVPVIVSITLALDLNPIPYIFITAAAFNCAYILPTSIRAIPVGHGLNPRYMMKNGVVLTVMGIVVITIMGYLMLRFWPAFSLA